MICRIGFRALTRNHAKLYPGLGIRPQVVPCSCGATRNSRPRCLSRFYTSLSRIPDPDEWRTASTKSAVSDTIYALSTAPGRAAIAVIRISGPACLDIYRSLCPNRPLPNPRTATLRRLYNPTECDSASSQVLDNGALVLYFPAPNTVTGEDVLELHVHGGSAIVRSVLDAILKCGRKFRHTRVPIRHAEPGEFTKRAFFNGRLDLTQAEALGETLAAETEQQRRLAVSGADGGLAKRYEKWRTMLLHARGELEALIDFSEDQHFDESPVEFMASISMQVNKIKRQIELHLKNATKGELLRNGISIALLGAPNAGKSSLLNRIVGREAAIVSAEEGTTRDIVDVSVDLNGWLCRLGDMAGLRSIAAGENHGHVGLVEQEGMRRARERALQSEVVVVLLSIERQDDGALDIPVNAQVLEAVEECHAAEKTILVVLNKIDIIKQHHQKTTAQELRSQVNHFFPMIPEGRICLISCREAAAPASPATSDPGCIQAFLTQLTSAFTELTTASVGEETGVMTPAEAQSYWTASLSVTHRQSSYLLLCLHQLNDFLAQSQFQSHRQTELSESPISSPRSLEYDHHLDRHDDLVGPNIAHEDTGVDIVAAAEHLRFAADFLAKITGKGEGGDVEDVLGVVFEK